MKQSKYSLLSLQIIQDTLQVSPRTSNRIYKKLKSYYNPKSNRLLVYHFYDFYSIDD